MNDDITEVEISINHAKDLIAFRDALRRLKANKDFKKLIEDGYFVTEASRLVLLKADDAMQSEESQESIEKQIMGIGQLNRYFTVIEFMGSQAERSLAEDEYTLEELTREAL